MKMSVSVTKGKGNTNHNKRLNPNQLSNVDHSRTKYNVTPLDIDIREAYREIFDESVEEYNSRQKRTDRKIDDYYRKIAHSQKEKTFHELVIQVGNKDNHADMETSNYVYQRFLEEFIKANPQLKVIGAYIHHDEMTPHMHLDYIPIADYDRGMKKRISNNRAVMQMGYKSWEGWREKQFDMFVGILKERNIEREDMNNTERHMSVAAYKETMRMAERQLQSIKEPEPKVHRILTKEFVSKKEYDKLAKQNSFLYAQYKAIQEVSKENEAILREIKKKPYIKENEALKRNVYQLESKLHDETEKTGDYDEIRDENRSLKKANEEMNRFIDGLGLRELFHRFILRHKTMERIIDICREAINVIREKIEAYEVKAEPRSVRERLREARNRKDEYVMDVYNTETGIQEQIRFESKDMAMDTMEMIRKDKDNRIDILKTRNNERIETLCERRKHEKEYEIEI